MSTKGGRIGRHKFYGDPERFQVLADYIAKNYSGKINKLVQRINKFDGKPIKRIADVGGGQGMLCRILKKKYNFDCQVIDPRGWTLVGIENRVEEYTSDMADYYDLIVGLHPDDALKEIAHSVLIRPVILIPCCNFWDNNKKLGRDALLLEIENFYRQNNINFERVVFNFSGPKNIGLISEPSSKQ